MFTVVNSSEGEWCCKATPEVPCRTQGFSQGAAMIGMIWTGMACDKHSQQFAGIRPVPHKYTF